jgi:hypothetical protein
MKHKNSHLLVGYWGRLLKGREVPDQTDVDPRALKRMLAYTFILDMATIARPTYRLAGTGLCERFGMELKGTNFLAHWETQSGVALASLLKQALRMKKPVCLSSIAATAANGMVELETTLVPVSFNGTEATRFLGLVQVLGDPSPLFGHTIAFERLVGSQIIREDEPLTTFDTLPPPPPPPTLRNHPKAPHLRLVISQDKPMTVHFESEDLLQGVFDMVRAITTGADLKLVR